MSNLRINYVFILVFSKSNYFDSFFPCLLHFMFSVQTLIILRHVFPMTGNSWDLFFIFLKQDYYLLRVGTMFILNIFIPITLACGLRL